MRNFLTIFRNRLIILSGLMTLCLGFVVIAGWHLKNATLIQIHPTLAPMQYNTALALALAGIGLIALSYKKYRISEIAGLSIFAIGFLTILQNILGVDFGLDQFFIKHYITTKTIHPGRMAPYTALCLMLSGIILFINSAGQRTAKRYIILKNLSTLLLLLGVTTLAGYLIQLDLTYQWEMLTRMALHTATGFIVVSLGLLAHLWFGENQKGLHWLSTLASLIVLIATISLWHRVALQEVEPLIQNIKEEQRLIADHTHNAFKSEVYALDRMRDRWEIRGGTPEAEWRGDAENYIKDQPGLIAIRWVDENLKTVWNVERGRKETTDKEAQQILTKLRLHTDLLTQNSKAFFLPPERSLDKNRTFQIAFPLNSEKGRDGNIIATFDIKNLFNSILPTPITRNYGVSLSINGSDIYANQGRRSSSIAHLEHTRALSILNAKLDLKIWPYESKLKANQSSLPDIVLFGGVALAVLLGISLNLAQQSLILARKFGESEKRMSLILNNIGEGVFGIDMKGRTTFANIAVQNMLGYSADEMLYKSQHELIHYHYPDNSEYPKEKCHIYQSLLQGNEAKIDNEVFWKKDGSSLPVEYTSRPIQGSNGDIEGAVVVFRDITQRKQAEVEQQQLIAKLARSNEELDEFAHIASHDLKEPLRAIHNHSRFLLEDYEDKLDEEGTKKLNRLISLTKRMEKLISDLLYYSRLGREKLAIKETDLNDVIADLRDTFQDTFEEKNVSLIVPEKLPTLTCDTVRVTELFRNLITNAIKYNENDHKIIEIGIKVIEEIIFRSSASKETLIYVKDNGIGIDEEFHKDVFRIFKRLHNNKKYGEGSGSGLTFVKKIVNQHGGKIWINSQDEGGTTFFFTLSGEKA